MKYKFNIVQDKQDSEQVKHVSVRLVIDRVGNARLEYYSDKLGWIEAAYVTQTGNVELVVDNIGYSDE